MIATDREKLIEFLRASAAQGYANAETTIADEPDRSHTITFSIGDFRLHDNWFTSKDSHRFHGREIIFYSDAPVWFSAYSGYVEPHIDPSQVYTFLRQALLKPDPKLPIRGQRGYFDGVWHYRLDTVVGDLERFTAIEYITDGKDQVYSAHLMGGEIN